jgi:hypothetical protein
VRDLRNGNLINNVTRSSARKLWRYAITKVEEGFPDPDKIEWHDNLAVFNVRKKHEHTWYDLALRDGQNIHVYFGVTDSGLNDEWVELVDASLSGKRRGLPKRSGPRVCASPNTPCFPVVSPEYAGKR